MPFIFMKVKKYLFQNEIRQKTSLAACFYQKNYQKNQLVTLLHRFTGFQA